MTCEFGVEHIIIGVAGIFLGMLFACLLDMLCNWLLPGLDKEINRPRKIEIDIKGDME